ncbi:uncharacterized protein MONBRDRAFT_25662 [Monosiga brevicollis MX1]|uniref:DUF4062 domain-containing protein n=1 Tax=Monosiga brevicollis TaxID=81824 RepID=A9V021_MONBE|nr:uncharacterized protein MONBRDRAFT_25662 [Monosiga brevicollis MX1]EDQ89080.1 predicted protein [Monosiga brevicollis MX1]|eukprot:XP_001746185.1 hypothetical protein [Monosiga brevicollis MX1]
MAHQVDAQPSLGPDGLSADAHSDDRVRINLHGPQLEALRRSVIEKGQITIFLSSPFVTMEHERTLFVESYVPMLKATCESRGILLKVVDLRWGITQEQADENETLLICLKELSLSDIFVGLYGRRYGSCYDPADPNSAWVLHNFEQAKAEHPWIMNYQDRAVTEIEFRHGFLNNPTAVRLPNIARRMHRMSPNGSLCPTNHVCTCLILTPSFVAFRDAAYDERIYQEALAKSDRGLARKYTPPPPGQIAALQRLRQECFNAALSAQREGKGCLLLRDYEEPEDVVLEMYTFVRKLLQSILPVMSVTHEARILRNHRAFSLAKQRMFVGRTNFLAELNKHAYPSDTSSHDGKLICVAGEAGLGKSAVLARWIHAYPHADTTVAFHHLGCDATSTSLHGILSNIALQLNIEVPESHDLHAVFEAFVAAASALTPAPTGNPPPSKRAHQASSTSTPVTQHIFLVLDGVNRLNDTTYTWLPGRRTFTMEWVSALVQRVSGLTVIVSTSDEHQLSRLRQMHAVILPLSPLAPDEQRAIAEAHISAASKTLPDHLRDQLLENPHTTNALFLEFALQELVQFGRHSLLPGKIQELAACTSLQELIAVILKRLENLFIHVPQANGRNVVANVFCFLACSRHGLTIDDELRPILGLDSPHMSLKWSQLYFAIKMFLTVRDGAYNLHHDAIRQAVKTHYLQDTPGYHLALAALFLSFKGRCRRDTLDTFPTHHRTLDEIEAHPMLREVRTTWFPSSPPETTAERLASVPSATTQASNTTVVGSGALDLRALSELPFHLCRGQAVDSAIALLTSIPFLHAKSIAGLSFELLEDLELLRSMSSHDGIRALHRVVQTFRYDFVRKQHNLWQALLNQPNNGFWHRRALSASRQRPLHSDTERDFQLLPLLLEWQNKPNTRDVCRGIFSEHTGIVHGCAVSLCGRFGLSVGREGAVCFWDVERHRLVRRFDAHEGKVSACAFEPSFSEPTYAVSGGKDRKLILHDLATGHDELLLEWSGSSKSGELVRCVTLRVPAAALPHRRAALRRQRTEPSSDGAGVAASVRPSLTSESSVEDHTDDVDVVVVGTGDRKVIVYDITGRQVIHRLEGHQGSLRDLAAVPDLHLVLSCDAVSVRMWNVCTGRQVGVLDGLADVFGVTARIARPDVNEESATRALLQVAVATGKQVDLYEAFCVNDAWRLSRSRSCVGPRNKVRCTSFADDGQLVIGGADDNQLHLWRVRDGTFVTSIAGHSGAISQLSALGDTLVSSSCDKTMRLFDLSHGTEGLNEAADSQYLPLHRAAVLGCAWVTSQSFLTASADAAASVWGISLQNELAYRGHSNWILCCDAMQSDVCSWGACAVVGSQDTTLSVFDLTQGQARASLRGHSGPVTGCCFVDDSHVASCSQDGTGRLWRLDRQNDVTCVWTFRAKEPLRAVVAMPNADGPDQVVFASEQGVVYLASVCGDGKANVIFQAKSAVTAVVWLWSESLLFVATQSGNVYALQDPMFTRPAPDRGTEVDTQESDNAVNSEAQPEHVVPAENLIRGQTGESLTQCKAGANALSSIAITCSADNCLRLAVGDVVGHVALLDSQEPLSALSVP